MERTIVGKSIEEVETILPRFKEEYTKKPTVIGTGLSADYPDKGSIRFVFKAYLEHEPTSDQKQFLGEYYEDIPIKYSISGKVIAASA